MAMRPAPVQASFIGYLNTTGVRAIGYRIVDGNTDPPPAPGAEELSTEKLVRLAPTYWCYRAPTNAPQPTRTGGGIVFGSFNSAVKINERVIALWSSVLKAVPGAGSAQGVRLRG
jgi:predicted O-linked N-acetylglucosamine transferase (SPINDLY family)